MSARTARHERRRARPSGQALCGARLTPAHRITVHGVILLVVVVLVSGGHSAGDATGLVVAAGAAAAQICSRLNGQRPAGSFGAA
ncbi:hypothetical protein [Streptomyces sp. NPDC093094]|uniref:hypothetical protein n=1 Tax=Streptomyces sp. NPDC093094 TaxID=3366026 RepID=UPI0037FA7EC6